MTDTQKIHFWNYILDNESKPIENAEVRLYLNDNPTTEANIFLTKTSSSYTICSNADIKTDNNGFFEFWIGNEWETGGYPFTQEFRLEWYKAGIEPGLIENINPWPNAFSWENQNTGSDADHINKFISDYYFNKWLDHYNEIVPSASPHNLGAVDFSSCGDNIYNKVISNKMLNDIFTTASNLSSGSSLSGSCIAEYQEDISSGSWIVSGSNYYYYDTTHTGVSGQNVSVQVASGGSLKEYFEPIKIINFNSTVTRILISNNIDVRVNIQGSNS